MSKKKPKYYGKWANPVTGEIKEIYFNRKYGNYYFSDEECERLLKGETIAIHSKAMKSGNYYEVGLHLAINSNGMVRLHTTSAKKERVIGIWEHDNISEKVSFSRVFSNHRFTDEECAKLLKGETITIDCITKTGEHSIVNGKLASFGTHVGFKTLISVGFRKIDWLTPEREYKTVYIAQSWCKHTFTETEIEKLAKGESINITAVGKNGQFFRCRGKLKRDALTNGGIRVRFAVEEFIHE